MNTPVITSLHSSSTEKTCDFSLNWVTAPIFRYIHNK